MWEAAGGEEEEGGGLSPYGPGGPGFWDGAGAPQGPWERRESKGVKEENGTGALGEMIGAHDRGGTREGREGGTRRACLPGGHQVLRELP